VARRYSFLQFQSDVDWKHVNRSLLTRLNRLGMALHKVITVTSGYRTNVEQARLYARYVASGYDNRYIAAKPGQSMHNKGLAVDAVIDGTPLSSAVSSRQLKKYGLSAPVAGDPVHIQLSGKGTPTVDVQPEPQPADTATTPSAVTDSLPQVTPTQTPATMPQPQESLPQALPPGTVPAEGAVSQDPAATWRLIAAQPLASEDTRLFASRLGG
jgi:hypothetical protein